MEIKNRSALSQGVFFILLAVLILSLQNVGIKWLKGDYPALEIVLIRSLVALPLTLVFYRMEGLRGFPRTRRINLEALRGMLLFLSYTTHMMGMASLQLDQVESLRFSGPLMITFLSIFLLREKTEFRRLLALGIGFVGMLLIITPGSATFNLGSVFILVSVLFYALTVILTRTLQSEDSSATMSFYSSLMYLLLTALLSPIFAAFGGQAGFDPSIAFLLNRWVAPGLLDLTVMAGLGLVWAGWMYFMSKAYSLAPASIIAPFEYAALPVNILWGWAIFQNTPTLMTIIGALIALGSGLYITYRGQRTISTPVVTDLKG